ncbi:decarboxylating cobalt-precorrin-6B (C(15))-methyltransferase [Furfurilactobacillus rossiae]|uniref:Cobalt-precorrin-6Y C(15)-methyltransferase n=1 Tax=Furfurilactobacillus rossiae DSM 15814 TaxID=1114972 RepID=A0A0R1RHG6_9LACO|nr:decarboxylating cobalt-precorrin-6B (C(15))-methyltransferase [Furfurilactobacillus rossiae]KRL56166.1 cobalt-precorrin-6Y C(15)-methyltransferase [Furfurilactobacillus rossiae DSM 15814]MCF6165855.1 decarboxylating cobalt-precorrin-6B (C(15))-methyltransferase [Furfurilactobacillus rossiae]QFR66187.1 decarboxylating cobalt-precorrin-6B (C(15))-methyltransferase [Furfurilactobacillus rossiae]QLE61623.1 Cobalt-precorrin-6y C15-methyltransferase decarboxylating [Furfurilactobacillus rossiae]Q
MKDSEFIRTKVPMTKQEVRAISIDRLGLKDGQQFLDVGAGTGSISIQVAKTQPLTHVTSIEHTPAAIDIMQQNIDHFGLHNIDLITGEAPSDIPDQQYDAIFIGGSGSELSTIIQFAQDHLKPGGQVVMNFILLENALEAVKTCESLDMGNIDFTNITVGNWHGLGKGHFFKMNNPTFILSATRKEVN